MLLTAMIWGFAFVAQRAGMEHVGPFMFNGIRFGLGSLALIPLILLRNPDRSEGSHSTSSVPTYKEISQCTPFLSVPHWAKRSSTVTEGGIKTLFWGGVLTGLALFFGANFQQVGIVYTTAGKAGFITGLYVIIVPIMGMLWGQKTGLETWVGAVLAVVGLYLLSMTGAFAISKGDLLVLICAFFWAIHVHLIGRFSPKVDPIKLASLQFAVCSVLSLIVSFIFETNSLQSVFDAAIPILYAGLMSTGIAYTLQVVAQRKVPPSRAAIILSLEAVFAVIGGWLMLGEVMSLRSLLGCTLMLTGMFFSQIQKSA